jgi:hypothetical protein
MAPRNRASAVVPGRSFVVLFVAALTALAGTIAARPPEMAEMGALDCRPAAVGADAPMRCRYVGPDGAARPLSARVRSAGGSAEGVLRWRVMARGEAAPEAIVDVFGGQKRHALVGKGGLELLPGPGAEDIVAVAVSVE